MPLLDPLMYGGWPQLASGGACVSNPLTADGGAKWRLFLLSLQTSQFFFIRQVASMLLLVVQGLLHDGVRDVGVAIVKKKLYDR